MKNQRFLSFTEAKKVVRRLGFQVHSEYLALSADERARRRLPARPEEVYRQSWQGWREFLGTEFLSYAKAKALMQQLGIDSVGEYKSLSGEDRLALRLPANPCASFGDEWEGWPAFFSRSPRRRRRGGTASYADARRALNDLGIASENEYRRLSASLRRRQGLPDDPPGTYRGEWRGWKVFLAKRIRIRVNEVASLEDAKAIVRKEKVRSVADYHARGARWRQRHKLPAQPTKRYGVSWRELFNR